MPRFEDPVQAIGVGTGERFSIALACNPTTGYLWEAGVDAGYLELDSQEFEPAGGGVGAGGREVFHFNTLAPGETDISFECRRPWDKTAHDTRQVRVRIE